MKKIIYVLLGCVGLAMVSFLVFKEIKADDQAPQIIIDEKAVINYSTGCDTEILLTGVQVLDNVDGNITEELVVENVYDFNNGQAKIIYVAKDKAGNITKAERLVEYNMSNQQTEPTTGVAVY